MLARHSAVLVAGIMYIIILILSMLVAKLKASKQAGIIRVLNLIFIHINSYLDIGLEKKGALPLFQKSLGSPCLGGYIKVCRHNLINKYRPVV